MTNSVQPVLLTSKLDRLVSFYTDLFDATQIARVPEDGDAFYIGLLIGQSTLGLVAEAEASGPEVPQRVLLSVTVDSVDALLERAQAAGGTLVGGPNDMPWGQRVAHLKDPDGNAVNLTQDL